MKVVLISDTHLRHRAELIDIPKCDLLIHAGDALSGGDAGELRSFAAWLDSLEATHKVFVAGNHDVIFEKNPYEARKLLPRDVIYLEGDMTEVAGLKIYGAPWQPEFCDWAFNLKRGWPLKEKWEAVPAGVDILVTHGPPLGILDYSRFSQQHVGCEDLRREIDRIKPRLHVFGHIHGGYGISRLGDTVFVNAAICDESYRADHSPIVLEMEPGVGPVAVHGSSLMPPSRAPVPIRNATPPLWD